MCCPLLLTLGEHVFREMFNRTALFALSKGFAVSALKGLTFASSVVQLGAWITSKMLVVLKCYQPWADWMSLNSIADTASVYDQNRAFHPL